MTTMRTTAQEIQTSEATTCDAAASRIVNIVRKATPIAIEIKGILPNINIGRTADGTASRIS